MNPQCDALPQLGERLFVTDSGLETTLIHHYGLELLSFAAFDLLKSATCSEVLSGSYGPDATDYAVAHIFH
jgi:hypothetical protein